MRELKLYGSDKNFSVLCFFFLQLLFVVLAKNISNKRKRLFHQGRYTNTRSGLKKQGPAEFF